MTIEERLALTTTLTGVAPGVPFQTIDPTILYIKTTENTTMNAVNLATGELYDLLPNTPVIPRPDVIVMARMTPKLVEVAQ